MSAPRGLSLFLSSVGYHELVLSTVEYDDR